MTYLDLFSGLGGFPLGAYWAGMRFDRHYFSEVDPWAVELYQTRFPDAIPLGDIKEIDCAKLADTESARRQARTSYTMGNGEPEVVTSHRDSWIITGGFPCQDISFAGKGEGIRESRSGLWFEMWRIIRDLRPRFVIAENVGALTIRGLNVVLSSLAEIGYDAEWQDIRAEDVGAQHRRERIWIVAYPNGTGQQQRRRPEPIPETFPAAECCGEVSHAPSRGRREAELRRQEPPGATGAATMADTEKRTERPGLCEGEQAGEWWRRLGDGHGPHGNWWAVEPPVDRLAYGISDRVAQLRGLGNAIVPQIAELLFRQIKEAL